MKVFEILQNIFSELFQVKPKRDVRGELNTDFQMSFGK